MDRAPPQSNPLLCTHKLQDSFLKLHCQSRQQPLVFASKRRNFICTPAMPPFDFQPVQLLELSDADSPSIDVQDGQLILTAQRGQERIRITAPLKQVLPQVSATVVQAPKRKRRAVPYGLRISGPSKRQGQNNKLSKLTDEAVREIRLIASDENFVKSYPSTQSLYEELARTYKVHFTTIRNIVLGASWKHVKI
jgi:hypothetical protein